MKLSIIVPVYNEESTLDEIIRRVLATPFDKEVIIVDDGSTDGTKKILDGFKRLKVYAYCDMKPITGRVLPLLLA